MGLSETTKNILRKYGWSENRKFDVTEYVKFLKKDGFNVSPKAEEFMCMFGGLQLKMPLMWGPGETGLHFNAIVAARDIFPYSVEQYERRVGEPLTPVGEAYDGYFTIMISKSGKMFGAFEDTLRKEGEDFEEGIEALYSQKETPEIP